MDDAVTLLLVEDEPIVLVAAQAALEDGGYACLTAMNGHEAIKLIEQESAIIRALVTDIRMEGPDGWEVARRARELKPDLPIVYTTAHGAAEWTSQGVPNSLLLPKPYADAQLVAAVTQLLNAAAQSPVVPNG